jgi:hypothetical protein
VAPRVGLTSENKVVEAAGIEFPSVTSTDYQLPGGSAKQLRRSMFLRCTSSASESLQPRQRASDRLALDLRVDRDGTNCPGGNVPCASSVKIVGMSEQPTRPLPRLRFPNGIDADGHLLEPPDLWER